MRLLLSVDEAGAASLQFLDESGKAVQRIPALPEPKAPAAKTPGK